MDYLDDQARSQLNTHDAIHQELAILESRIQEGINRIASWEAQKGTQNLRYHQHLKHLQEEADQLRQRLATPHPVITALDTPVSLWEQYTATIEVRYHAILKQYRTLLTLGLKGLYHSKRYRKLEKDIGAAMLVYPDLFDLLYNIPLEVALGTSVLHS